MILECVLQLRYVQKHLFRLIIPMQLNCLPFFPVFTLVLFSCQNQQVAFYAVIVQYVYSVKLQEWLGDDMNDDNGKEFMNACCIWS